MKIRIIRPYKDTLLDRYTKINEILEVTPNRLKELQERVPGYFEVIDIRQEEPKEETKEIEEQTQDLTEIVEEIKEEVKEVIKESSKEDKPKTTTKKKATKK